ncbi:metallo-beta-lactamase family protein, putative [Heliomicrobium modesticaldum Ice1]|uniref:Metallo-beta-lactamase family protein, putative n=1 Tax=Heliobacterium modesticaldum (strain ATCC 51547 / Ice1) TaxID=498761 RepID=B0TF86_HELMI|nr:MBL fold metallo-hydrolase [Heliomicrobium modesticaldum]ABZ84403.1 metallo-beta-lactamase family protein, putative [Heliomicrobium modesticaldum Ice1]
MNIRRWEAGMLAANCYLVQCPETGEAALIDPGGDGEMLLRRAEEAKAKIVAIINTHGHSDHIAANGDIKKATGATILCHEAEAASIISPGKNLSLYIGASITSPPADRLLKDGDVLTIGRTVRLEVLHTPGHTVGGICLRGQGVVFTGDTLFHGSIGRTDLPGGSYNQILHSIREKLLALPDDTVVYPGHGPESTIGFERVNNPFLTE